MKDEWSYKEEDEIAAIRVAKNHNIQREDDLDVEVFSSRQERLKEDIDIDMKSNSDDAPNIGN